MAHRYAAGVATETPLNDFGLLIAFILPGFVALFGGTFLVPSLQGLLHVGSGGEPSIGGFLYGTIAAVAAGMTISTVRWLLLDTLHHATGLRPPHWDFSDFDRKVDAFEILNNVHYRYYQFYGNTLVAVIWSYSVWRISGPGRSTPIGAADVGVGLLVLLFYLGSRDTLGKYYRRAGAMLSRAGKNAKA